MNGLPLRACAAVLSVSTWCAAACAQYRTDNQPVVEAPPPAAPRPVLDVAPRFADAYRRSGQPRIVLMWNREFTDKTQTATVDREITRESGKASSSSLEKTTQGEADSATLKESDEIYDRSKTVTSGTQAVEEPARRVTLAERHAVMLQRAFTIEMRRAGVRFIDRALVMRTTAAMQHRSGGDPKLIETDALVSHADLVMEVLMVEDKDTPAGYGFDVRAKDLRKGHEVASLYSRGIPPAPPQAPAVWMAGPNGYELQSAARSASPTPAEIGAALANDVMLALGGNLEAARIMPRKQP